MEYLSVAPVASFIFAITIIWSVLAFSNQNMYGQFMLHPYSVYRREHVYTVITSGFIHKDWMHLLFNMFSFFFFGFTLERYLGHWQFGVLYFVSMILSDLPTVAKHKEDYWYHSLGASGAISAVIFGFILFEPMTGMMIMPIPIAIPAIIFGPLYLVYCSYSSRYSRDNINHDAHFYGALSGIMITIALKPAVLHSFFYQVSAGIQSFLHR
jgi:membrane associated rhomboid family serine protease